MKNQVHAQMLSCLVSTRWTMMLGAQDGVILLTPPPTITKGQIDEIVEKLSAALRKIT